MSPVHDAMTSAYGFGLFPLPAYRPARQGDWRISVHMPSIGDGYLSVTTIEERAVLARDRQVWMSTGLLERQSHAWHVHCAEGIVVTAGLGMGMYVYAAAMKPTVDLVIAADISSDVIDLMHQSTGFGHWQFKTKVRIIEADALSADFAARVAQVTGGRPIDYLYADVWPTFPAVEAPLQTADMARALRPKAAGWWGQELSFAEHCRRSEWAVDEQTLRDYFAEAGIPAPPITAGYAAFCRDVMMAYGMGRKEPLRRRLRDFVRWHSQVERPVERAAAASRARRD